MPDFPPFDHDDAMIEQTGRDGQARHRVYAVDQVAVVIGRGGKADVELHRQAIADDGVAVLRRRGGGCSVVLDPGNVIVSLALPKAGLGGITSAFAELSSLMCELLAECGIPDVTQRGTSDLAVGERKLGGSCIHRMRGLLYYSTTLLVAPDLDLLDRYLAHPPREPDYRRGRPHREFVITLRQMGFSPSVEEFLSQLVNGLRSRSYGGT